MFEFMMESFRFFDNQADPRGPKEVGCLVPLLLVMALVVGGVCWLGVKPAKKPPAPISKVSHWLHRRIH